MKPGVEAAVASFVVTAVVGVGAHFIPKSQVATFVGLAFLGATWFFVWRKSDEEVERHALGFGGLLLGGEVDKAAAARAAVRALKWAGVFSLAIAVPYYFGWMFWWHPMSKFVVDVHPREFGSEVMGQLLLIALPEEAFYRGYLQTRLDDAIPPKWKIFGATIGPSLFIGAAIFAIGHVITIRAPARLGVFFPALLFGWLRARTGGVGAGVVFHAFCNIYSEILGRGYGAY